ncbi:MAG: flagellar filament capping protein FliD [Burkholderiaceae bacterium]
MATSPISGAGVIDVNSIVSQLMAVERQPLSRMQTSLNGIQTQLSEVGKLQGALDAFRSAARGLTQLDTWRAARATSSDSDQVAASASSGALAGNYAVEVDELAQYQTIVTGPHADPDAAIGGGTLTIQLGSEATPGGGGFIADPGRAAIGVPIPDGATLADIRNAINDLDTGVTASIVTDANGTRLMLRSTESGANQAFSVTVDDNDNTDGDDAGLSQLRYEPAGTYTQISRVQTASDASFSINGLSLASSTNSPEGAIENVTLNLRQKTSSPVEIGIETDAEAIRAKVDAFVSAYNELNSLIRTQTRFDADTGTAGPMQGNRTVLLIQSRLRETLRASVDEVGIGNLSDIGIRVQRDGSLAVDSGSFKAALADPEQLQAFFAADDPDPNRIGIARRLDTLVGEILGVDGAITSATDSLQARKESITDQQDRFNLRLTQIEARLRRQYTALDSNLSNLQGSLASIAQLTNSS